MIKLNKRGYALITFLSVLLVYFHFRNKSEINDDTVNLSYLLDTAIQAAEAGGKFVVSVRNELKVQSKGKTNEGMEDSVTTADFLSHCAMERLFSQRFPLVRFISEETNTQCDNDRIYDEPEKHAITLPDISFKTNDVTVWIDPLDATHEYTEKLYQYVTTMVCIAVNGDPIVGVIHNPFTGSTSWAVVGYSHSKDLDQYVKKSPAKIKVIISRSHSGEIQKVLNKSFGNVEVVIAAGAGYKSLMVAKNMVDAYLHITAIKKWDICAGNAILNALGGKMTTKNGKTLTYFNDTDVVNKEGLIATMRNHEIFVDKL